MHLPGSFLCSHQRTDLSNTSTASRSFFESDVHTKIDLVKDIDFVKLFLKCLHIPQPVVPVGGHDVGPDVDPLLAHGDGAVLVGGRPKD